MPVKCQLVKYRQSQRGHRQERLRAICELTSASSDCKPSRAPGSQTPDRCRACKRLPAHKRNEAVDWIFPTKRFESRPPKPNRAKARSAEFWGGATVRQGNIV